MVPAHVGLRTAPSEHQGGEWAKIPAEIFQDLIVLMPQRCRQVVNIGGAASLLSVGWGLKRPLFLLRKRNFSPFLDLRPSYSDGRIGQIFFLGHISLSERKPS